MDTKEKKKFNYFKFVWVAGMFSILILILVVVMNYKIYHEMKIGYMYFYECSLDVCYSYKEDEVGNNKKYSKYSYTHKIPEVNMLGNNYVVMDGNVLYNYVTGNVVTEDYVSYKIVGYNIIVGNGEKYGVIDSNNNLLIPLEYDKIESEDGIYFVVNGDEGSYNLIDSNSNVILEDYSYIYEYNNVIVMVKDMKLNIKDIDGNDLIGKTLEVYDSNNLISVYYDDNLLYIKIYVEEKYYKYTYNMDTKELINLTS